ncbi:MAG: radical SAM protein [Ignavibacteria bacterium RBG_13_36_8]|nr:MAG: radical SAM protein [Ignavibacteria bacterium RBG_13_36_8]
MESQIINHRNLYRLPWNLADNAISWLEPTAACNLACDGCYRKNEPNSHKTIDEIKNELGVFKRLRNSDCISIAGGDPLVYPNIIELVREIKLHGWKPIINTNGKTLTMKLLKELKKAGVFGFTFHVDSKQAGRGSEWKDKNELDLNELRLHYAQMLADVGGIACSFNSTVYEDTVQYVPDLVGWAQKHIDIVNTMVFIIFRYIIPKMPFDWYAGSRKVEWQKIMYHSDENRKVDLLSTDLLKLVKERFPDFHPCAYLNGTQKVDSYKWLLTERVGTKKKLYGYPGSKFMELMMTSHHFINGTYLSYASPSLSKMGRSGMFFLWPFDKGLRKAFLKMLKNPLRIFKRAHFQTILFIQPVDFMETGEQSMCDGCPDITVYKDNLVWSCRLEEPKRYGVFLRSVPREN